MKIIRCKDCAFGNKDGKTVFCCPLLGATMFSWSFCSNGTSYDGDSENGEIAKMLEDISEKEKL